MSAKAESFVAGADINMLEKADSAALTRLSQLSHRIFEKIEKFRLPVVAAILGLPKLFELSVQIFSEHTCIGRTLYEGLNHRIYTDEVF